MRHIERKCGADGLRRYNAWAGNPQGVKENTAHCIASVYPNERGAMEHQCLRKRGHGPGGLYCRLHDPTVREQKEQDERRAREARENEQRNIEREGHRLAKLLGCGQPHYHVPIRPSERGGYVPQLRITYEDARALISRLGKEAK